MGIFSDILESAASSAYNKVKQSININNANQKGEISIIFSPCHEMQMVESIRKDAMESLFVNIAQILGLELDNKYFGICYLIKNEDGLVTPMWLNFVIFNGGYLVKQGTCGMGQGGITIYGDEAKDLATEIIKVLNALKFDNIQLYFEEIPYHDDDWLLGASIKIQENFEDYVSATNNGDTNNSQQEEE